MPAVLAGSLLAYLHQSLFVYSSAPQHYLSRLHLQRTTHTVAQLRRVSELRTVDTVTLLCRNSSGIVQVFYLPQRLKEILVFVLILSLPALCPDPILDFSSIDPMNFFLFRILRQDRLINPIFGVALAGLNL